jgi:hypothetical protein
MKVIFCDRQWRRLFGVLSVLVFLWGCVEGEKPAATNTAVNDIPVSLIISSPSNEASVLHGEDVYFEAFIDNEEMVDGPVVWTSNLDGQIGVESKLKYSQLSEGRHTIIASVKDKTGEDAVDSLELIVDKFTWAAQYKKHYQLNPRISNEPLDLASVERILKTTKNFDRKNLSGLDLSGKKIDGVSFEDAFMVHCNFSHAEFKNVNLKNAAIEYSNLSKASFKNVDFTGVNFSNVNLSGADLSRMYLSDFSMIRTNMTGFNLFQTN